jgi:hypothetical protein
MAEQLSARRGASSPKQVVGLYFRLRLLLFLPQDRADCHSFSPNFHPILRLVLLNLAGVASLVSTDRSHRLLLVFAGSRFPRTRLTPSLGSSRSARMLSREGRQEGPEMSPVVVLHSAPSRSEEGDRLRTLHGEPRKSHGRRVPRSTIPMSHSWAGTHVHVEFQTLLLIHRQPTVKLPFDPFLHQQHHKVKLSWNPFNPFPHRVVSSSKTIPYTVHPPSRPVGTERQKAARRVSSPSFVSSARWPANILLIQHWQRKTRKRHQRAYKSSPGGEIPLTFELLSYFSCCNWPQILFLSALW